MCLRLVNSGGRAVIGTGSTMVENDPNKDVED